MESKQAPRGRNSKRPFFGKLSRKSKNQIGIALGSVALLAMFQNCTGQSFSATLQSSLDSTSLSDGSGSPPAPGGQPPALPAPVPLGGTVTDLKVQNLAASSQTNVPFTFGQTFPQGALLKSETLAGKLSSGSLINLQVEAKATHADGSVRHAIISGILPSLNASQTETISLVKAAASSAGSLAVTPQSLLDAGFGAAVNLTIGGVSYSASAKEALLAKSYQSWLSGPFANEWLVAVPLKTSAGVAHPHLMARFDVRSYTGLNKARVDVIIENGWNYEPGPQNFLYDVQVNVGGQTVYSKAGLTHYHHSRWKKTFWWGDAPNIHLKHNTNYLILSRALPNYDPTVVVPESALAGLQTSWSQAKTDPMNYGIAQPYMGTTGGRPDIGLNPAWAVIYLLSQDVRAKNVMLGQADLSGSWPMHFRDKDKDLVHSIIDYPYSGLNGNPGDKVNPVTKKSEDFPACGGDCNVPAQADVSHHPNMNYIPYLITGDHYYLEELQFWAAYTVYGANPWYRDFEKGNVRAEQLRGQGWALRTLGDAAFITPDDHPLKTQFNGFVNNNMDWYNTNYTNSSTANQLGVIVTGYSISYNNGRGIAPWMDDFFTQSIGHLTELGFTKAEPLLKWKAKFAIARMTDPGFCWIFGSIYSLNIRDSETSPFYTTMAQAYQASVSSAIQATTCASPEMAAALSADLGYKVETGDMTGYPDSESGFPANYQPALAVAVTSGAANGQKAWDVFMNRKTKPNYGNGPQFDIVPRK